MRIETAIKHLMSNYNNAEQNDYMKDKVAWALYITWREVEMIRESEEYAKRAVKEGED